jgi:uncharacterized protein
MYLARLSVAAFVQKAPFIWRELSTRFRLVHGVAAGGSEVTSWKQSLPALAQVLACAEELRDCFVYLEYGLPSVSSRADAFIAGLDSQRRRSGVVVELKQWDAASAIVDGEAVRVGGIAHPHPSDQALGYGEYLADLSAGFSDQARNLRTCSYLHNTLAHGIERLRQSPFEKLMRLSPLWSGDQREAFAR